MSTIKWELDSAHSEFQFRARHMVISSVSGKFEQFHVTAETERDNLESARIVASVETDSINTGTKDRDNHLRSDDFFNAEKYPEIVFKSTSLQKRNDEEYTLKGDLTIRENTKPISLEVEFGGKIKDPYGNQRMGFTVTGKISRKEYGLKWNELIESGGAIVGDVIKIDCHVEFIHKEE